MASNNARKMKPRRTRGFSLLEMLLTVGVTGTFLLFIVGIGRTIAQEQVDRTSASYVQQLDRAVASMLGNPLRFNTLYNAIGGTLIRQASVSDLINGTGVLAGMGRNPILSANFPTTAPLNQTYRIVFRIADNFGSSADNRILETYILSETKLPDTRATAIAGLLGGSGGALRDAGNAATANIRGVYGSWVVPMTNMAGTAWHATVVGATPPTLQNGSYVVSYQYVDINRVAKDYLYRTNVGDVELNTMRGDLSLGGFNLIGADDVTTAGTTTTDQIIVKGNARLQGATTITGNLQGDGPSTMGAVTAPAGVASQIVVPGGNFNGNSTVTANQAVFSDMTTNGLAASGGIAAENATLNNGQLTVTSGGLFAGTQAAGFVVNGPTTVGADFKATELRGTNMTVNSGNTGMIFMQSSQNLTHNGSLGAIDRLSVGGTARAGGNVNWTCNNGC